MSEWYGSLRSDWEDRYLSQTCDKQCNKNAGNQEENVLSLSYGQIIRKKNKYAGLMPSDFSTYQIVESGNIILRLTDLQNDHTSLRTGLVRERGIITSAYCCLKPWENPDYLHYLLHAYDTQKNFYGLGGGVRQSIGFKDIRYVHLPYPSRAEQDQIVRFLDWKVSQINKLINMKKRQSALLQEQKQCVICFAVTRGLNADTHLKASGVEWIGEIPKNWDICRCKYLFSERNARSKTGAETHLSMSQKYGLVPDSQLDERRMLSESYIGGKLCHKDDLVLNRLKAHLGVFALAPQSGVISPDYTVLKVNTEKILPAFAQYALHCDKCRPELRIRVRGVVEGFWRLYTEDFNTIKLPLPPLDEQQQILSYIQSYSDKIDRIVTSNETGISLLQEYRTHIITDVVTGKIDVRDTVIPEYELAKDLVINDDNSFAEEPDFNESEN
jgi:type I restriction enzyme S subunit